MDDSGFGYSQERACAALSNPPVHNPSFCFSSFHQHLGKSDHQATSELLPHILSYVSLWVRVGCCWGNRYMLINLWKEWHSSGFSTYKLWAAHKEMAVSEIIFLCCVLKYATLNQCSGYDVVAGTHAMAVTREKLNGLPLAVWWSHEQSTDDVKALIPYSTKLSDLGVLMRRQETMPDLSLTACQGWYTQLTRGQSHMVLLRVTKRHATD